MAINTSFLPQDYVEKRMERRTNAICITLFCIVTLGVVGVWLVINRQQAADQRMTEDDDRKFVEADQRLQQLDDMQARRAEMMQKAQVTKVLLERVPRTLILSELINNMPLSMTLLGVDLSTRVVSSHPAPTTLIDKAKLERNQGLPDVQVPDTEVTLEVVGVTPTDVNVAQFMTSLGKSPIFQDLTLNYTEDMEVDTAHMRKFGISMTIDQTVDIKSIQPRMVKRDDVMKNPMAGPMEMNSEGRLTMPPTTPVPHDSIIPAASR